jgi:hypothetical protein
MVQKQNEQLLNDEIITTFLFLNHDYTEEDEKDEFKVFFYSSSSVKSWFKNKMNSY